MVNKFYGSVAVLCVFAVAVFLSSGRAGSFLQYRSSPSDGDDILGSIPSSYSSSNGKLQLLDVDNSSGGGKEDRRLAFGSTTPPPRHRPSPPSVEELQQEQARLSRIIRKQYPISLIGEVPAVDQEFFVEFNSSVDVVDLRGGIISPAMQEQFLGPPLSTSSITTNIHEEADEFSDDQSRHSGERHGADPGGEVDEHQEESSGEATTTKTVDQFASDMKTLHSALAAIGVHGTDNKTAVAFSPSVAAALEQLRRFRFLGSEVIYAKYGLVNVLLAYTSLIATAVVERRVAMDSALSPVRIEQLLDLKASSRQLSRYLDQGGSVALLPFSASISAQLHAAFPQQGFTNAKARGLSYGSRTKSQSLHASVAGNVFRRRFVKTAAALRDSPVVISRNFFEAFPFRSVAPLDPCAIMARLVPAPKIRKAAQIILGTMRRRRGTRYLMVVHLRVEKDRHLVRQELKHSKTAEVVAFWKRNISPLAAAAGIDAIYIASGKFDDEGLFAALVAAEPSRMVFRKQSFPAALRHISLQEDARTLVTSHVAAMLDAMIAKVAHVVVAFKPSTFSLLLMGKRCPRHKKLSKRNQLILRSAWCQPKSLEKLDSASSVDALLEHVVSRGTKLMTRQRQQEGLKNGTSFETTTLHPCHDDVVEKIVNQSLLEKGGDNFRRESQMPRIELALRGLFLYDIDKKGAFSKSLEYAPCGAKNFGFGQCFKELDV